MFVASKLVLRADFQMKLLLPCYARGSGLVHPLRKLKI